MNLSEKARNYISENNFNDFVLQTAIDNDKKINAMELQNSVRSLFKDQQGQKQAVRSLIRVIHNFEIENLLDRKKPNTHDYILTEKGKDAYEIGYNQYWEEIKENKTLEKQLLISNIQTNYNVQKSLENQKLTNAITVTVSVLTLIVLSFQVGYSIKQSNNNKHIEAQVSSLQNQLKKLQQPVSNQDHLNDSLKEVSKKESTTIDLTYPKN